MAVTIDSSPGIRSNQAEFEVSTSLVEGASYQNVRVEAVMKFADEKGNLRTVKKVKPKGLLTFDFTDILNSVIKYKVPTFYQSEGMEMTHVGVRGIELMTSWTNVDWDSLSVVAGGAGITSGAHDGDVSGDGYFASNTFAVTEGDILVFHLDPLSVGGDAPSIVLNGVTSYGKNEIDSAGNYYFLVTETGTASFRVYIYAPDICTSIAFTNLVYKLELNDWWMNYGVTFTEKYENASDVTTSGTPKKADDCFNHFQSPEITEAIFLASYVCQAGADYPLNHYHNTGREDQHYGRGAVMLKSDVLIVSSFIACVVAKTFVEGRVYYEKYDKDGGSNGTGYTSTVANYSNLVFIVISSDTFSTDTIRVDVRLRDGSTNDKSDTIRNYALQGAKPSQKYMPIHIHWINNLGGISNMTFFSEFRITGKIEREVYKDSERLIKNIRAFGHRLVQVNSGQLPVLDNFEYDIKFWESLLSATEAWLHVEEDVVKEITIESDDLELRPVDREFWEINLAFIYQTDKV